MVTKVIKKYAIKVIIVELKDLEYNQKKISFLKFIIIIKKKNTANAPASESTRKN